MKGLKQNVGIDIAKDSFVATVTVLLEGQQIKHLKTKKFTNNQDGFISFWEWSCSLTDNSIANSYTMEATGVYYEGLAYFLWGKETIIHVLLPSMAKKFSQSLNVKTKTDKIDSKVLGHMGAERALEKWTLSSGIYRKIRTLTRERQQLVKEKTRCKNQLHAEEHTAEPLRSTITRYRNHISFLEKQIIAVEKELKKLIAKDDFVAEKIKKVTTIPGISDVTVATVAAETSGFANIKNIRQLNSYAGYDIVQKESGNWKGKSRISKKGNSRIRQALYMPSLSTICHTKTYKEFYTRLNERKQNGMVSGTAVQRKLLGLIYTLWKNDSEYVDNYEQKKAG